MKNVVRFLHYRTWTFGRAVPACDPSGKHKVSRQGQMTPDRDKVTCHLCKARLEGGEAEPRIIGFARG